MKKLIKKLMNIFKSSNDEEPETKQDGRKKYNVKAKPKRIKGLNPKKKKTSDKKKR